MQAWKYSNFERRRGLLACGAGIEGDKTGGEIRVDEKGWG